MLDADRRKAIILADAKDLAFAQGLTLVEDEGLLEEVAGLVEWPVVLMGEFEAAFLDLPAEVIRATIRANQKCFVLREAPASSSVMAVPGLDRGSTRPSTRRRQARKRTEPRRGTAWMAGTRPAMTREGARGKLANKFILVSNLVAPDGGAAIAAGNGRVVRARLSDARHFWRTDLAPLPDAKDKAAKPLDQRLEKLERVVFHEKLGTQGERIERIEALARELAPKVGADAELAARAAHLAKADLATEMVGEFPELQGLMGRYYAIAQGEEPSVADGDRGALQAARAERPHPHFAGLDRGRARRQARHARRLLGDRREADRQQGPLCAAARGAWRDPHRAGEWAAAVAATDCFEQLALLLGRSTISSSAEDARLLNWC